MIPKIIHYCWFGGNPLPQEFKDYIEGWKQMYPDFKIIQWDESNFDVDNAIFTKEAYSVKKYAFVADYVRMWALHQYGGLYMDTDIKVIKRINEDWLNNDRFLAAMEYHEDNARILNYKDRLTPEGYKKDPKDILKYICLESSIFAAEANHPFINDCLSYYKDRHFVLSDGSYYDKIIVPVIMAIEADKYGLRYVNEFQELKEGMHIIPCEYFTNPHLQTPNTLVLHMAKNSWVNLTFKQKIYQTLQHNKVILGVYRWLESFSLTKRFFDYVQKKTWLEND